MYQSCVNKKYTCNTKLLCNFVVFSNGGKQFDIVKGDLVENHLEFAFLFETMRGLLFQCHFKKGMLSLKISVVKL